MGTIYEFRKTFTIPGDGPQCIELDVPPRGKIRTMILVETIGGQAGFEFEIFTNREVCPPSINDEGQSISSSSSAPGSVPAKELYSVFGVKLTTESVFQEFAVQHPYETEGGSTNRSRKLYLRIQPSGTLDVSSSSISSASGGTVNTPAINGLPREYQMKLVIESSDLDS